MTQISLANSLLGYTRDTRLLIINADDFGMCHSINKAIICTLEKGLVRSTTLMVPCPWALHAMHFLSEHPEIAFGVHLTVISDPDLFRWGPITSKEKVPSLVDPMGYFYKFDSMSFLLSQIRLDQLEEEFRAQIETVLSAGLKPSHLDWHALRFGHRADIFDLIIALAKEYGLALRVIGSRVVNALRKQGFPTSDYDFLDSYLMDPVKKPALYTQLLRELPAGLSEWAVHPGIENAELHVLEPDGNHERQTDFDFWTSQQAKDTIEEEGIILLDYRSLQEFWKRG